ncbi:MAG: SDR family oxidoreductase [Nitrososphaeraceae archaeon]
MAESILVTGATGTLGSEVVKQLLSAKGKNVNVKAAARSVNDNTFESLNGVQVVQLDYNNPSMLARAFKDTDKLFLLTPASPKAAELATNLVNEAKKAGIRHIVKQSVIGADSVLDVAHLRLHRQAEKIVEESGIPFTFLRPNDFMQNFVNFYNPTIKSKNAFYLPAEDAKVSFVDVRDIAAIAVKTLTEDDDGNGSRHNGKAYNITGPEALTCYQVAEILSNATGKKISYVNISEEDTRLGMKDMGWDDWLINTILQLYDLYRKGYASQVTDAVESITGNKPISFAQFAMDHAEAFR